MNWDILVKQLSDLAENPKVRTWNLMSERRIEFDMTVVNARRHIMDAQKRTDDAMYYIQQLETMLDDTKLNMKPSIHRRPLSEDQESDED